MPRIALCALLLVLLAPALARADWNGDFHGDVMGVDPDGNLILYTPPGDGTFGGIPGRQIGTSWQQFDTLVSPGDFSGDGFADLLARRPAGELLLYRGNGAGGFLPDDPRPTLGQGWQTLDALIGPGDWDGDGKVDILGRTTADGRLLLYRGDGAGGVAAPTPIGTGWAQYTALFSPGDFSGDGYPDVLARTSTGDLLLFRGDGAGGFKPGSPVIGTGWQRFTAFMGGDFNSDGKPDVLVRDGITLLRYSGDGAGGFLPDQGTKIGSSGWDNRANLVLVGGSPPGTVVAPTPPQPTVAPPAVTLQTGLRCTPPGQRVRIALRVRKPTSRSRARVRRIVFKVRGGQRKVDRKAPFTVRLRHGGKPGTKVKVTARVVYTRPGSKKLRRQTVSKRYAICA